MGIFPSILTGVTIFVLGQFLLRLVLDPVVSLKEALSELSHVFLWNQATITNANANGDAALRQEIKQVTANLLAKSECVPLYALSFRVFALPDSKAIAESCKDLNFIAYAVDQSTIDSPKSKVAPLAVKKISDLEEKLKVRLSYK